MNMLPQDYKDAKRILNNLSIDDKQKVISKCSEIPEKFGSDFFACLLESETDPICQWYLIRSLSNFKTKKHISILIKILLKPDIPTGKSSLHKICAYSIGSIGKEVVADLIPLLSSNMKQTQIAVIDAFGEIGDAIAIPHLFEMMKKKDRDIILWASLSLSKIGEPAIEALVESISCVEEVEIMIILDALVKIGTKKIFKPIANLLKSYPKIVSNYFDSYKDEARNMVHLLSKEIKLKTRFTPEATEIINFLTINKTMH